MAERKGSGRFESEPRSTKGDRNLGGIPAIEAGLARAAADRWRQADGRLPDSVASVTQRQPITHADLFPADARPSRLRMALYGTAAAVSLILGGSALALLFMPGGDSGAPTEQQVASVEPPASVTPETASDASPDGALAPPSRVEASVAETSATPSPVAEPSAPAVDATTTGTAPQARWMERWAADADPEAQATASAEASEGDLGEALRESLPPPAASQPAPAAEAPAPSNAAPPSAAASPVRVIDTGPTAEQAEPLPAPAPAPASAPVGLPPAVAAAPATPPSARSPATAPEPEPEPEPEPAPAANELVATPPVVLEPEPEPEAQPPAAATETAALPAPQGGRPGRIVSPVNLRASGERGAAILGTVAGGTELQVIACDLWCEIVTADGRRGFVFKDFVTTAQ